MKLYRHHRDGLKWKCSKRNCCGRSEKTIRHDSIFNGRKIAINKVILVIYLFLARIQMTQMEILTGLHHDTIYKIVMDIYYAMECDLEINDVQVGK